jgi:hypothetical protein
MKNKKRDLANHPICKFCKEPVISKTDLRAILGHEHKKGCPRRRSPRAR